jgi:hypothetical protein
VDAPALEMLGQAHGVEHARKQGGTDRPVAHQLADRLVRRGVAEW